MSRFVRRLRSNRYLTTVETSMSHVELDLVLPTGLRLRCVDAGPRDGVPVAMLHGITDSWRSFEPLLPHLPRAWRTIAVSQRGHGDSDRPRDGYGSADYAADLAQVLDALGVRSAFVVGHSMGATNALRFACDHPNRTRGLVLLGAFAEYADHEALVEYVRAAVEPLRDPVPRPFAREFQQSTLAHAIAPALLDVFVDESLKLPARVWRAAFGALLADDVIAQARGITVPVHAVWGGADAYCRTLDRERLAAALPHATTRIVAGAGHALHWEDPASIAREITAFVGAVAVAG